MDLKYFFICVFLNLHYIIVGSIESKIQLINYSCFSKFSVICSYEPFFLFWYSGSMPNLFFSVLLCELATDLTLTPSLFSLFLNYGIVGIPLFCDDEILLSLLWCSCGLLYKMSWALPLTLWLLLDLFLMGVLSLLNFIPVLANL